MKVDPLTGGAVPVLSGSEILDSVPQVRGVADVLVRDFSTLPGPHMTPAKCIELSGRVAAALDDPAIAGAVVTHGTDTMEETAFLLDLTIRSPKPVVFVGAMKNASELSWDGPANLLAAARVASSPLSRDRGVLVVMNDEIHAASEVTKTHTERVDTFRSPNFGPLGVVDKGTVLYYRDLPRRVSIPATGIDPAVDIFTAVIGADDRLIRYSVDSGSHGIVIEGTGRGNVTPWMASGIQYAISKGLPVVLVSRCPGGRVLDTYAYDGGGRRLRQMGVIFGDTLNGQKARVLLMVALGAGLSRDAIKQAFEQGRYE